MIQAWLATEGVKVFLKFLPYIAIVTILAGAYFWIGSLRSDVEKYEKDLLEANAKISVYEANMDKIEKGMVISATFDKEVVDVHHYHEKKVVEIKETINQIVDGKTIKCEGLTDEETQQWFDMLNDQWKRMAK